MTQPLVSVKQLSKAYQEHHAVKAMSFDVYEGEILCLLGPNGAGKTTTIHMISALLKPDAGDILYQGTSILTSKHDFQKQLGFVPQNLALYEDISAYENLKFFAGLYGLKKEIKQQAVQEALVFAGLSDRAKDKVATYSTGMKRRLNIACGILHHPKLVIMDEPTVGIDPQSRNHILESIQKLRDEGMTILYTTHYMEEVEAISTRILIMDHGELMQQGTKESLKENLEQQHRYVLQVSYPNLIQVDALYAIEGVSKVEVKANILSITSMKQVENLDRIIRSVIDQKLMIQNLTHEQTTLETVFLNLTGRSLRD